MRKIKESKLFRLFWLAFVCVLLASSCVNSSSGSDDDGYDEAKKVLEKIGEKVRIDSTGKDSKGESCIVYFYFTQPVDHNDLSKGEFEQYCALHYRGKDNKTVLMTNGYSISEKNNFEIEDLAFIYDANYLEVEHRYCKNSDIGLPEPYTGSYWDYNIAEQATADLHDIVTTFKASSEFEGKWISTGLSKNGILTAMYAFKYPNEVDAYVSFGAPFLPGQEELSVGNYLAYICGSENVDAKSGKTVNELVWEALSDYLGDPEAQTAVENYVKKNIEDYKYSSSDDIRRNITYKYVTTLFCKFSYISWDVWSSFIPLCSKFKKIDEIYAECFYLFAISDESNLMINLEELKKIFPTDEGDSQRTLQTFKTALAHQSPERVEENAYFVQAAMELGYYLYDWSKIEEYLSEDDLNLFYEWETIRSRETNFGVTYDNGKLMNDFFKFLKQNSSKDKCRMLFIYGGNDPWTGGAIPDLHADGVYIKKIIIPNGTHNSFLQLEDCYPKEYREEIISVINKFLE